MNPNIGVRYGRAIIVEFVERKNKHNWYKSKCDCGNYFVTTLNNLRRGNTKSCGCFQKEVIKEQFSTHKLSSSPEYNAYRTMINRCEDLKHIQYADYGARGISVCKRWKDSFENFIEDMGMRPKLKYQLDRINNNGNYNKENCKWVSPKQNIRNSSITKKYKIGLETKTLKEWSKQFNINSVCVRKRLTRGWSLEEALTTPSANVNSIPETNEDKFI